MHFLNWCVFLFSFLVFKFNLFIFLIIITTIIIFFTKFYLFLISPICFPRSYILFLISPVYFFYYPLVGMHMMRCELSIGHIHGLPNGSSRSGVLNRQDFKGIKWGLYPNESLVGGSIGGGIYPNRSQTRYFTLTGQSA